MTGGTASPPDAAPRRPLVLVGPTASGKSATALALARRRRRLGGRPVELVSCDSMQVYRGMDVGTATPTAAERAEVPHHLLDVVDPHEDFDVARFRDLVAGALEDIAARGAEAVLVGGTGLYVRAVVDALRLAGRFPEVAAHLDGLSTQELTERLRELDPVAAARVAPGNRRRLVRALEVTLGSGRRFSDAGPGLGTFPPTPFHQAGLRVDRPELAVRIEQRLHRQLDAGFLDEVARLVADPRGRSRTAATALGYRELADHLAGRCTLDQAVTVTVGRTRRFAVRQERWFRRDPRIAWFDAPGGTARGADVVAEEVDRWWEAADAGNRAGDHSAGPQTAAGSRATTATVAPPPATSRAAATTPTEHPCD